MNSLLTNHLNITPQHERALSHLGIKTVRDMLYHFPIRYKSFEDQKAIVDLSEGEEATIQGRVISAKAEKTWKRKMNIARTVVSDGTASLRIVWFNQPYMANILSGNVMHTFSGKVQKDKKGLFMANPRFESKAPFTKEKEVIIEKGDQLVPYYPETKGISSRWLTFAIQKIFKAIEKNEIQLADPLPDDIRARYKLPDIVQALRAIHFPKKNTHIETARKRFAFEEIFFIQLVRQRERMERKNHPSFVLATPQKTLPDFLGSLPFSLTNAQTKAIDIIFKNLTDETPMARLLEGDVGSGKTVVAASAINAVLEEGMQSAFMAPTEVVARQHYQELQTLFKNKRINIGLITSSECRKFPSKINKNQDTHIARNQLLVWTKTGEINILVGTHALIQEKVAFKHLALAVVDEQHRFGIRQRAILAGRRPTRNSTQTNAENVTTEEESNHKTQLLYEDISYKIRGAVFEVKKHLGLGHKENAYHQALVEEFKQRGVQFETEKSIDIFYNKKKISNYRPDFIVEDKILIELKSLNFVGEREKKQVWSYLKGSQYKLAFLINFGNKDVEIKRIVYDTARSQRKSALDQRESAQQTLPHLLSMTATPIPRTLALTIYGDLDLTLLDEMPPGRKQIETKIVEPDKRKNAYEFMRKEIQNGRQAFVVCPRIADPSQTNADNTKTDAENLRRKSAFDPRKSALMMDMKSVKAEYKKLSKDIFPEFEIGMLHGQMLPKEKEKAMDAFRQGKTQVLVATSVIEVGVNVPNATIMMIEGAERFGLAQLHQLRGRVLRGTHQPYCFVFTDSTSQKTEDRLRALTQAKNGFELAEYDLQFRGAGELTGIKQWGISDVGMMALQNLKMVEAARTEAHTLLAHDFELKKYPLLQEKIETLTKSPIHFE